MTGRLLIILVGGVSVLYIRVGDFTDNCIIDVSNYFNLFKKKEWFADPFVRKVIKGVDASEVIKDEYIESPVFGGMSPERLSSGVKALILMKMYPEYVVYATRCGDNCATFILELAKQQDVTIMLHNCMTFPDDVHAIFLDSQREVHNYNEFIEEYFKLRG